MNLVCLHGFGGGPELFDNYQDKGYPCWTPDLYLEFDPTCTIEDFILAFTEKVEVIFSGEPVFVLGYSMGARLALNALIKKPTLFQGAVLVSCGPGLFTEDKKVHREQFESYWERKFINESWEVIQAQWAALGIFRGTADVPLRQDISRETLGKNLKTWSPAGHIFNFEDLKGNQVPLVWVSGSRDEKYNKIYSDLEAQKVPGQYIQLFGGHRLFADCSQQVYDQVQNFMSEGKV